MLETSTAYRSIISKIQSGVIKRIAVLTGAGISTASGIPDFRSAGGMYDTLKPELLTATAQEKQIMKADPTMVVNINLFLRNQFPYLEVRRPFILGTAEQKWKATLSHFFFKALFDRGLLTRVYTQNIDGLDYQVGLPDSMIVPVHGSIGRAACEFCSASYPMDKFREEVKCRIKNIYDETDTSAPRSSSSILCMACKRPGVKAATVMYGSSLSADVCSKFEEDFPDNIDLLIIIGKIRLYSAPFIVILFYFYPLRM